MGQKRRRSSHGGLATQKMFAALNKRTSLMDTDATFLALRGSFSEYTQKICTSEPAKEAGKSEVVKLIEYVKELPKIAEEGEWTDLRYEAVLEAWVEFIRNNIKHKGKGKTMTAADTKSATWIIRLMRSMIEYEWGFSIDERDDDGDEESDEVVKPVQDALNQVGATTLCLDLIAPGMDLRLMLEAVKLLVGLLYKEGGNVDVQTTINEHLRKDESSYFFAAAQERSSFFRFVPLGAIIKLTAAVTFSTAAGGVVMPFNSPNDPLSRPPKAASALMMAGSAAAKSLFACSWKAITSFCTSATFASSTSSQFACFVPTLVHTLG